MVRDEPAAEDKGGYIVRTATSRAWFRPMTIVQPVCGPTPIDKTAAEALWRLSEKITNLKFTL